MLIWFYPGIVEPLAGVVGAALVTWITPILPYALAFAAGAMVYVVVDDIVPESQVSLMEQFMKSYAHMMSFKSF